jgi:hypothetical protein
MEISYETVIRFAELFTYRQQDSLQGMPFASVSFSALDRFT